MTERRRRRVVRLSEVDQRRLERGEAPSWSEPSGEPSLSGADESPYQGVDEALSNDDRLLSDVPPHWSPNRL